MAEAGVGQHVGVDGAGLKGIEQGATGILPGGGIGAGGGGHGQQVAGGREEIVALAEFDKGVESALVKGLAGLPGAHGLDAEGQHGLETHQLAEKVGSAGHHQRMLELVIQHEVGVQLHHRSLEGGAGLRVQRLGES